MLFGNSTLPQSDIPMILAPLASCEISHLSFNSTISKCILITHLYTQFFFFNPILPCLMFNSTISKCILITHLYTQFFFFNPILPCLIKKRGYYLYCGSLFPHSMAKNFKPFLILKSLTIPISKIITHNLSPNNSMKKKKKNPIYTIFFF